MFKNISRFYLNKKTFIIAIIATMILEPVGMIMEIKIDDVIPFELIAYGILFLLLIGLFITHHKKDYILLNGIVSGILMYEFVNAVYFLSVYIDNLEYYRSLGFFGCLCISIMFLFVTVIFLIAYNHFTLNRRRAVNRTKIILNQFLLFIVFLEPFIAIVMSSMIGLTVFEMITYIIVYASDAFLLLVVACCELQLAMNRNDETRLEEPVPSDIKATLWYAVSFLFSLFICCMNIILSNAKPLILILSIVDIIFSIGFLIYYLNKKKKPSSKLSIFIYVGFITTIGLMVFFIGHFVWTILF